jgi:hypothetical protein
MILKTVLCATGLLVAACSTLHATDYKTLQLTVEQGSPPPLPYQGIRVRLRLTNIGNQQISDLPLLEAACWITGMKSEDDSATRPIGKYGVFVLRPRLTTEVIPFDHSAALHRLELKPKQHETVSHAILGEWGSRDIWLFPKPGQYTVTMKYRPTRMLQEALEANPLTVVVRQPEGDDARIFLMLTKSPELAHDLTIAVAYRTGPSKETVPLLKKIELDYPKSSYADYARLALALHYRYQNDLQGTGRIPKVDRDAALACLEAIQSKDFPYLPDALLLVKELASDPEQAKRAYMRITRTFRDSIELLEAEASELSAQQLREMKSKAPIRKSPRSDN